MTFSNAEVVITSMGPRFDDEVLERTREFFEPLIDAPVVIEERDVAYGTHTRQRLDVFIPRASSRGVVIFVHGGGFVGGDKQVNQTFHANVGRFFAANAFACVIPNYRLAPQTQWPGPVQDIQKVVDWVRDNLAAAGPNGQPLFLIGQSAGACHVASWLFHDEARGAPLTPAAGVLLMSGLYRIARPLRANVQAYFGGDAAAYDYRSPINHVKPISVPLWLSVSEFDPGHMAAHTFDLAASVARVSGVQPAFELFRGHNHVSPILSLGSMHKSVGEAILCYLSRCITSR